MKYLVLLLLISGCTNKGTFVPVTDTVDSFHVELLFKKDNCSVYRFSDGGRSHCFTDCGETMSYKQKSGPENIK